MTSKMLETLMRDMLEAGTWPTAMALNRKLAVDGSWVEGDRSLEREDLNGRECAMRERLAAEYGWVRERRGGRSVWRRMLKGHAVVVGGFVRFESDSKASAASAASKLRKTGGDVRIQARP